MDEEPLSEAWQDILPKSLPRWRVIVSMPTEQNRRPNIWNVGLFMYRNPETGERGIFNSKREAARFIRALNNPSWTFRAVQSTSTGKWCDPDEMTRSERAFYNRVPPSVRTREYGTREYGTFYG